jgi:hypothetical protein
VRAGCVKPTLVRSLRAAPPTIAEERLALSSEIQAVEQTQLGTLVSRISQIAQTRQAEANLPAAGWQFATDAVKAVVGKNYTFHAVVALVAYTFMWIPGLMLNVVFLNQANKDQNDAGKAPEGKGCLLWLLWVFGIIPFVTIVLLIVIATLFASGSEP